MRRPALLLLALLLPQAALAAAGVEIGCAPAAVTARQGEKVVLRFTVHNRSPLRLETAAGFFLSYHVRDAAGRDVIFDNRRFALPAPVRPGTTAAFDLPVFFSHAPGRYLLEWDLVREGRFWGRDKGWSPAAVSLLLLPLVSQAFQKSWLPTFWESGSAVLDRGQYLLRQTLRNNEIRLGGRLFGFAAGSDYPQLWIRDTATILPYARFFYPADDLQAILDRFFAVQGRDGEVRDWVDSAGRCDKNTVESDQESSLVIAAWHLALDDPAWLAGQAAGVARLKRLDMALEWLWRNRRDPGRGLLWSGFTADWGDVERSHPDQRAIKLSDRSRRTYSTYAQALFVRAAQRLALMAERLGDPGMAARWRQRRQAVVDASRRQLYLPDRGYFIVHRVEGGGKALAWERNILAVGGNAEALRAGLMPGKEIARFLRALEERRGRYGLRSVSFTLLPPFPENFFPHPLLRVPWSYQNGGEWDWIGGRLVSALYENGFREEADRYLEEIVAKNLADMNLFEWSDRNGNGRGALFYAGAAGVLGEAILFGRLGLREEFDRYSLPVASDRYKLTVSKSGDRFTAEISGKAIIDIASLAKKEICVVPASGKKTCVSKKGRSEIANQQNYQR